MIMHDHECDAAKEQLGRSLVQFALHRKDVTCPVCIADLNDMREKNMPVPGWPMVQIKEHVWVNSDSITAIDFDNGRIFFGSTSIAFPQNWTPKIIEQMNAGTATDYAVREDDDGMEEEDEYQRWLNHRARYVKETNLATLRDEQAAEKDERPHSRACGIYPHPHGQMCSADCPTCGGKPDGYETDTLDANRVSVRHGAMTKDVLGLEEHEASESFRNTLQRLKDNPPAKQEVLGEWVPRKGGLIDFFKKNGIALRQPHTTELEGDSLVIKSADQEVVPWVPPDMFSPTKPVPEEVSIDEEHSIDHVQRAFNNGETFVVEHTVVMGKKDE